MIIGQPGAGKSTLARQVADLARLPVVHIDHIHWQSGWVERPRDEKTMLCHEVEARERWVFEGGHSATWDNRLDRADTLIWLDMPVSLRLWRVTARSLHHRGRTRPDLPEGCPEQIDPEFYRFIWRTRRTGRAKMQALFEGMPSHKRGFHLRSPKAVRGFVTALDYALRKGTMTD